MRSIHRLLATAAALSTAVILAACSSGSGSIGSGSTAQPRGAKEHGGTVTVAWPATPNFIFPLPPATNTDGYNENLNNPMWPALVYAGDGVPVGREPAGEPVHVDDLVQRRQDRHHRPQALELVRRHAGHQPGLHVRLQPAAANCPTGTTTSPACSPPTWPAWPRPTRTPWCSPDPLLQPTRSTSDDVLTSRAAAAPARLGQDLGRRPGRQLRRDQGRGQGGVQLPAEGRQPDEHVRHQPAVEGGRRAVDAVLLPEQRHLQLRRRTSTTPARTSRSCPRWSTRRSPPTPPC